MMPRWRIPEHTDDERGVILILVLGFIAFMGLVSVVLLNYVSTSFNASAGLRTIRSAQYAADGAVEGAINKLRQFYPSATSACGGTTNFYTVTPPLNGQAIVLTCTNPVFTAPSQLDVTFTATCPSAGSVGCPASGGVGVAMLTARVRFTGSPPTVAATILDWSVRR
jgi:Tfp pilus assembly protein PilX